MNSNNSNTLEKEFSDNFFNSLKRNDPVGSIEASFYSYYGYVRNMEALGKSYDEQLYNYASKEFYSWKNNH